MKCVVLFSLLFGCRHKSSGGDSRDTAAGESDGLSGCPSLSGVIESDMSPEWQYTGVTYPYYAVWLSRYARDIDVDSGVLHISEYYDAFSLGGSYELVQFLTCTCDRAGLSITTTQYFDKYYDYALDAGATYLTDGTITYDAPVLLLPAEVEPGDSWAASRSGVVTSSTGSPYTMVDDTVATAVGFEDLSLAGGDFAALRIDETSSWGTLSKWYAVGMGLVKVGELELSDYDEGFPVESGDR